MNILLIDHYAGSIYHGMEYRCYYMAREWVRAGHNVLIAAADQSHLRSKKVIIPDNKLYFSEKIDGITYLWFKTVEYSGNGIKRALNMVSFIMQLFKHGKIIAKKFLPDIVLTSSTYPADIFPAHYIANLSKAKLIYEIHDIWPLSPMLLGNMSKYHPFIMGMQFAEDYCYKHCDAIVSVLPNVHEHVKEHGLPIHKLHVIANGICVDEWNTNIKIPEELENIINKEKSKGNFIIGYAGGHATSNSLNTVIDAAENLKEEKISFILVGNGTEKQHLIESAQAKALTNTIFYNSIPKNSIPCLLNSCDALLITWAKQWDLYKFGVSPNKIMDYMMAKKPVIQAIEASNDIVKDSGCGISVTAEDPKALAEAIKQMMQISSEERKNMGIRGQQYVKANHDYKVLSQKLLNIMKNL